MSRLACQAHRRLYHSILGLRVIKKKKERGSGLADRLAREVEEVLDVEEVGRQDQVEEHLRVRV